MLFNSIEFLVFFAVFLAALPLFRSGNNRRWLYLVAASFFFYGWWDWRFLLLLIGSGLIDFAAGLGMNRFPARRKLLLGISIVGNLAALTSFKYLDFLIDSANALLPALGFDRAIMPIELILPIGISFYTFQSMSYTIDVYRGKLEPTRNVLHFFAYLSMFPQLVAGPVVRASHLLPQLARNVKATEQQRWDGLTLIVRGYFKKVVIADALAPTIAAAFGATTLVESGLYWWVIMAMFAFQIYGDFSGYSDIARGLAKWIGYDFPVNFNHPYLAVGFRDFWSRWHISLSTWFRDYVYVPLGGSRRGRAAGHLNMWATMLLSGLWHGAAWTFVAWGAAHAAFLSIERVTQWPRRLARLPGGRHVAVVLVFGAVLSTWVFFRAESFAQAGTVLGLMFSVTRFAPGAVQELIHWRELLPVAVMLLYHAFLHLKLTLPAIEWPRLRPALQPIAIAAGIWACVFLRGPGNAFIYFQF